MGRAVCERLHSFSNTGQEDHEPGALPNRVVHSNVAATLIHDSVNGGQPEAGSFAFFFRREEWFENLVLDFLWYAGSRVRNREHHIIAPTHLSLSRLCHRVVADTACFNGQTATRRHRISR